MPLRKYQTPAAACAARKKKMAGYMRDSYTRAAYVIPTIRLDKKHADALDKIMAAESVGPSDAVRFALVAAAAKIRSTR